VDERAPMTGGPTAAEVRAQSGNAREAAGVTNRGAIALLDRDDAALVVVDAQPHFLPMEAESAVERMAWLVAIAALLGIPVVVTEEEPERNGVTDARIANRLPAGAPVFTKPTFGLAGTPVILNALHETGCGTVVLIGCETDVCVAQSAIGLQANGFRCVVVEDATFSPGEMQERGLARIVSEGIGRNHAKGVTYEWLRTVEDARAVFSDSSLPSPPFRL
jgi:nicotinamidase-related amidase